MSYFQQTNSYNASEIEGLKKDLIETNQAITVLSRQMSSLTILVEKIKATKPTQQINAQTQTVETRDAVTQTNRLLSFILRGRELEARQCMSEGHTVNENNTYHWDNFDFYPGLINNTRSLSRSPPPVDENHNQNDELFGTIPPESSESIDLPTGKTSQRVKVRGFRGRAIMRGAGRGRGQGRGQGRVQKHDKSPKNTPMTKTTGRARGRKRKSIVPKILQSKKKVQKRILSDIESSSSSSDSE